jgi:ribosomal protein S18 acetylase RimI-like enzyme
MWMQRQDILALYDRELRVNAPLPGAEFRYERAGTILRLVGPSPAEHDNCVVFSRLDAAGADAAIGGEIDRFASLGHAFEWKLHSHDEPADLADRLLRHGFAADPAETIMVRDLADEPPRPPAALAVEIRRIDDSAELSGLVAVQNEVWNEDHAWYGEALARELAADPAQIEILVAYAQTRAVATSLMRLHRGTRFGSLWGAATLPSFQRRGLYTALVERHVETGLAAGVRLLTVDANENSRPVLERVGFRALVGVQGFVWRPTG